MITNKSTYLGSIKDVRGTTVSITLANESLSGLTYVNGEGYRIGQIGSFVKIPIGYIELFGIVTQVGASALPKPELNEINGFRWLTIQLIGEGYRNGRFERGISQYPTIGDEVHLVSEDDLKKIYGRPNEPYFVKIGNIAGAESIPALIDVNKLINRHSAIVGTTGCGKSTTVASLLTSLSNLDQYPSSRILVIDIHGEYCKALKDRASIYKINSDPQKGERELFLPFWALNFDELSALSFGSFSNEKEQNNLMEKILTAKKDSINKYPRIGIDTDTLSVDTPIPFSLNDLWHQLFIQTFGTYYRSQPGIAINNLAFEKDVKGHDLIGNAQNGVPPSFKKVKNDSGDPEKISYLPDALNIGQQLLSLGSKLRVPRFDFLFKPGDWLPEKDGKVNKDLDDLIKGWIGDDKPITILDLSGVPISVLNLVVGILLRILYDALFWSRNLAQGGRNRPLLIVMEEAHNYLNDNFTGLASIIVQRIAKEGRKYGIGSMIVSQRPSEINQTILSQCGTIFAMRLSNTLDRSHITGAVTDNLEGLTSMLPILRTGEAIILGEAVKLPMRCLIDPPKKDKRPDSFDPIVYDDKPFGESQNIGGWGINNISTIEEYKEIIRTWRSQNPISSQIIKSEIMVKTIVQSSTILSIGYDENTSTLEVEFLSGATYQYFDVPSQIHQDFISATSHGIYHAQNIKGIYRYAKV